MMILIDTISKVIYRYWLFLPLNYTLKTGSLSIYFFKSLVAIHVNLLLFFFFEGLNLATETVLMKTPLGGSSHFILFFRPVYLLSHLLSPCPQHKAAGKPPAPTGSSSPRPPPFPAWRSSESHRSQALPPCFLSSSSCFLTAHGFGPCQNPQQLPHESTPGSASAPVPAQEPGGTRWAWGGKGEAGQEAGWGRAAPSSCCGSPQHQHRVSVRRWLRQQGRHSSSPSRCRPYTQTGTCSKRHSGWKRAARTSTPKRTPQPAEPTMGKQKYF